MKHLLILLVCWAALCAGEAQEVKEVKDGGDRPLLVMHAADSIRSPKAANLPADTSHMSTDTVTHYGISMDAGAYTADLQPAFFKMTKSGTGEIGTIARSVGTIIAGGMLGGLGSMVAGKALNSADVKTLQMWIPGKSSSITCGVRPAFKFTIPEKLPARRDTASWVQFFLSDVHHPDEFQCVRFDTKNGNRYLPKKFSFTAMGKESDAVSTKRSDIPFEVSRNDDGTFRVYFPNPLKPGEYGFIYRDLDNIVYAARPCCFDFSVTN